MAFDYNDFESHFRGSREEIKNKLSIYLPLLQHLEVSASCPALDIACGRGEWLELLKENNFPGKGIDIDDKFVAYCRNNALDVHREDVFDFLDHSEKDQYKLITCFHFIEHISFEKQQEFLSKTSRLLAPGGIIIIETPNPENVTVGSCNFFIDPTHIRPLPPQLLEFLALQANIVSPLIARLNRYTLGDICRLMPESVPGSDIYNRFVEMVLSRLFQSPDYALIGFKPPAPDTAMLEAIDLINKDNLNRVPPPDSRERLKALIQLKEHELKHAHEEIWKKNEEIHNIHEQLHQRERELQSVYNTTAGKFVRFYKSWKRQLKERKKTRQSISSGKAIKERKTSHSHEPPEQSESVRNIYRQLINARSGK